MADVEDRTIINECWCCGEIFPISEMTQAETYDRITGDLLPREQWSWTSVDCRAGWASYLVKLDS
jgi:hypothetical protein